MTDSRKVLNTQCLRQISEKNWIIGDNRRDSAVTRFRAAFSTRRGANGTVFLTSFQTGFNPSRRSGFEIQDTRCRSD